MENNERERFGTLSGWSKELGIGDKSIRKQLSDSPYIQGKDRNGCIQKFYAETQVRKACFDLLRPLPTADETGCFILEVDGIQERYSTLNGWSILLPASIKIVRDRLKTFTGITGRTSAGVAFENAFYPESLVRRQLALELSGLPSVDENGYFVHDGQIHANAEVWSEALGINPNSIVNRLKKNEIQGISGTDRRGHTLENGFFTEVQIRKAIQDLLQKDLPQANLSGFLTVPDDTTQERYATIKGWSAALVLHFNTIKKRVIALQGIDGRDASGTIRLNAYLPESAVRLACADVLKEYPVANEDGFFVQNQEAFGSKMAWSRKVGISETTLTRRLGDRVGITGKSHRGHFLEHVFYSESTIREVCADLLPPPVSDGK